MHEDALPTMLEAAISKELKDQLVNSHHVPSASYHEYANFSKSLKIADVTSLLSINQSHPCQGNASITPPLATQNAFKPASTPAQTVVNSGPTLGEAITLDNVKGRELLTLAYVTSV